MFTVEGEVQWVTVSRVTSSFVVACCCLLCCCVCVEDVCGSILLRSHLGKHEASQMCVAAIGRCCVVVGGRGAVVVCSLCGPPRLWVCLFGLIVCRVLLVVVCGGCLQLRPPIVVVSG